MKPKALAKPSPESVMFLDYIITNEDGTILGIRDDAPELAKRQYEEYTKKYNENLQKGILI